MKDVARMFVATAVAAVVFVGLYVFLHWSLVISLLLAIGLYIGLTLFLKPSRKIAGIDVAEMPGGEALADLLDEADNDLTSIRSATKRILEPQVREQAQALYTTGTRICDYLEENPQKIRLARRFLTYYLDTTARSSRRLACAPVKWRKSSPKPHRHCQCSMMPLRVSSPISWKGS